MNRERTCFRRRRCRECDDVVRVGHIGPVGSPQPADNWQIEFVPYLWGSGIDGDVGIGSRSANVDASSSNILSHLEFAFMAAVEARRNRLVTLTDFIYTDLSRPPCDSRAPVFQRASRSETGHPHDRRRLPACEHRWWALDLVGGLRFWGLNSELQFEAGVLPGVGIDANRNWVDAVAGLRAKVGLAGNWWVSAYGDYGGGGSDRRLSSPEPAAWISVHATPSSLGTAISKSTTTAMASCLTTRSRGHCSVSPSNCE